MRTIQKLWAVVAGLFAMALPSLVHAQAAAYDIADAIEQTDSVALTLPLVGVALVSLAAIAMGWRWIKASFF